MQQFHCIKHPQQLVVTSRAATTGCCQTAAAIDQAYMIKARTNKIRCEHCADYRLVLQILAHAKYVLGYVVLGPVALLLLAEAVRVSGTLPGGHDIKTVTQSKWHRITLQVG